MTSPQKIISDCDSLIPLPEFQLFLFHQNGCCLKEASHIDFVHEKRHMDVGWLGGGALVMFLGEKSQKISIVCLKF